MNKVMLTAAITGVGDTVEKIQQLNVHVLGQQLHIFMHVTQKLVVLVTTQNYLEKLYD